MKRKALGKGLGLGALVPDVVTDTNGLIDLDIDMLMPNRFQPRQLFDQDALESLAASLKQHGLIQPITVRKSPEGGGQYELISGERRWRAAKLAGLITIPAIIKEVAEQELMEWALLENLQREDLNPIEKAKAYENLINEFSLTQEAIANRMGINRSSVSNFLRLLHLPEALWVEISEGLISMGHAKALLSLDSKAAQMKLADEIKTQHLSVRQTESAAQRLKLDAHPKQLPVPKVRNPEVERLETRLRHTLGTKVKITQQGKSGEIRISYYSINDLDRLLEQLS